MTGNGWIIQFTASNNKIQTVWLHFAWFYWIKSGLLLTIYIDIYNRSVMHVTAIEMAECNHYKQACHSELGVVFHFYFQNNLFVIIIGISWYQHWNWWNHGVILTPWYQQLQCWLRIFNFSSASTENFRWIPRSFVLRRWRGNSLLCEDPSQKSSDTISIKKFRVIA